MQKKFYVTTPIYYVNAEPHIGHAYTTILADFLKRFYMMIGYDSYFLTGTDEHGDKIVKAAQENNSTTEEYTDKISNIFRQAWHGIDIEFDDFIRTTEERHKRVVNHILQKVYDNGDIYFSSYGGDYCYGCERYLTERDKADGKCIEHNRPTEYIEENNYFFRMNKYQDWLIDYIKNNPDFIRPEKYKNEVLSILNNDVLEDLCISRPRSRLTWGIPLPFDANYVTYVWFDALINYISALGYPEEKNYRKYWPVSNHLIGKDIVKPHGIFWPTMLKAAGIEPYQHLNVHGFWIMDESKMSKSLGNVVTPFELVEKYGNDQLRYFLLREMTFGSDAKYSEESIIKRINYDLANDLGNLINRTFNMVVKYFEGRIPPFYKENSANRDELRELLKDTLNEYTKTVKEFRFNIGLEKLWQFIRYLNKYIDDNKPWQLFNEKNTELLSSVMRNILESIHSIAFLLQPILINTSPKIINALNSKLSDIDMGNILSFELLQDNIEIMDIGILFPRIDDKRKEKPSKETTLKKSEQKEKGLKEHVGLIDINDFSKVEIRVAKVIEASAIEGSDKLLQLMVDTGIDKRGIIAGIAKYYEPHYLIGKRILIVTNLKPATIFKHKSNGMLLAAKSDEDDKPILIEIDEKVPIGAKLG